MTEWKSCHGQPTYIVYYTFSWIFLLLKVLVNFYNTSRKLCFIFSLSHLFCINSIQFFVKWADLLLSLTSNQVYFLNWVKIWRKNCKRKDFFCTLFTFKGVGLLKVWLWQACNRPTHFKSGRKFSLRNSLCLKSDVLSYDDYDDELLSWLAFDFSIDAQKAISYEKGRSRGGGNLD